MERPQAPEPVPDLDWDPKKAREFGEQVLAIWEELLRQLPDLPVARAHSADQVRQAVAISVPDRPLPVDQLAAYLEDLALKWSTYPGHPGFMGYISGAGTVPGAVADLLAAGLNQNVGGWRLSPAATEIELHLMAWFADRFGLPQSAGGLFTSGGAMAAFTALKAARDAKARGKVQQAGLGDGPKPTIYVSSEAHIVNERAADMLGLGRDWVRYIPTDESLRMRVDALRDAVERDFAYGHQPIAVVATAGTVATGAIDPLDEIAGLCEGYGLWFHVDGAYGGVAALVDELQPLFAGIERADSIAFDPHKWLYTPHSGGAVLVADRHRLADSFAVEPAYLHEDKQLTGRGLDLLSMGPQFSRGFQALKVWVSLLAHGWAAYARRIAHDVELAGYLYDLAATRPDFETLTPQWLSIACFRYVPPDLPDGAEQESYLNRLNERLMAEIQQHGRVYPSNALIEERFWLRACIVNFRTEAEDVEALLDVAAELGDRLDGQLRPASLR